MILSLLQIETGDLFPSMIYVYSMFPLSGRVKLFFFGRFFIDYFFLGVYSLDWGSDLV